MSHAPHSPATENDGWSTFHPRQGIYVFGGLLLALCLFCGGLSVVLYESGKRHLPHNPLSIPLGTTAGEVRELLGPPDLRITYDNGRELWHYRVNPLGLET